MEREGERRGAAEVSLFRWEGGCTSFMATWNVPAAIARLQFAAGSKHIKRKWNFNYFVAICTNFSSAVFLIFFFYYYYLFYFTHAAVVLLFCFFCFQRGVANEVNVAQLNMHATCRRAGRQKLHLPVAKKRKTWQEAAAFWSVFASQKEERAVCFYKQLTWPKCRCQLGGKFSRDTHNSFMLNAGYSWLADRGRSGSGAAAAAYEVAN